MYYRIAFCVILLITCIINAQTINLHGKISNSKGQPVANAIVTLVNQVLKDTTGPDGLYSIKHSNVAVSPKELVPQFKNIVLEKGYIEFRLPQPSPVMIEIFDLRGKLLEKEMILNAAIGFLPL